MSSFQELAAEEVRVTSSSEDVVDNMFLQAKIEKRMKGEYVAKFMMGMDVPSLLYQRVLTSPKEGNSAWRSYIMPHTACILTNASDIEDLRTTQTFFEEQIDSVQNMFESRFEVTQENLENELRSIQSRIDTYERYHDEITVMRRQINTMNEENKELKRELNLFLKKKPLVTYYSVLINVVMIVILMMLMIPTTITATTEYMELP